MTLSDELQERLRRDLAEMRAGATPSDWMPRLLRRLADAPLLEERQLRSANPVRTSVLTTSEVRVVDAVSRGLEAQMVGDLLGISGNTVRSHLRAARYKLRAKNTTHACCEALRRGLIR